MDTVAERQMVVRGARDIEPMRLGKLRRVSIGRRQDYERRHIRLDLHAADFHIDLRIARGRLHRAVVTQHLFDRARHQRRIRAQHAQLVRIAPQRKHPVTDQIGGRFVAREQQQHHERDQLLFAQRIGLVAGHHQSADQVAARTASALFDLLDEICPQRIEGLDDMDRHFDSRCDHVGFYHAVGPPLELLVIVARHPKHLRDHHHRQRIRQVRHHLEIAFARSALEQRRREFADARFKILDPGRRERLADQPAQPRMDRGIGKDDARRAAEYRQSHFQKRRPRRHARKTLRITQDRERVRVARHQRHRNEQVHQMGRAAVKRLVMRVRVGAVRLVPRIEIDARRLCCGCHLLRCASR